MNKRKLEGEAFGAAESKRVAANATEGKKHTLDSDEEDFVDEDNVLDDNDFEGEEDGIARQEGEQKMTAFNMKEEMEEGHFDRDGHFIWNNEKEIKDNWLDNIDWQKIKENADGTGKYDIEEGLGAESSDSDDDEMRPKFNELDVYKKIIKYMKPKETITKALKRLGGADMKLSSVERLKRKKAGTLTSSEDVTNLTALANEILTKLGNMDVYQETFEQIQRKIDSKEKKNRTAAPVEGAELDMYADDFDDKEKEKLKDSDGNTAQLDAQEEVESSQPAELQWEFKWAIEDDEIRGPYATAQMVKWQNENYFKPGTMVRKVGEKSSFYSLSRIDFELYE